MSFVILFLVFINEYERILTNDNYIEFKHYLCVFTVSWWFPFNEKQENLGDASPVFYRSDVFFSVAQRTLKK